MKPLPEAFMKRMLAQLGEEAESFYNALKKPPPTSIRLHHKKGKSSFRTSGQVPWCDLGFYLEERPAFYLDPHWHAGAYYVQEASSMILDHVLKQLSLSHEGKIWVDMCAAPGGKTGLMAKHLQPADVLVANEVVSPRRTVLWENLSKAGFHNTFISGESIDSFQVPFADIILVDAPCAGEGMMRKESEAINQWNQALVESCSLLQKQIVQNAASALNPNGFLVYSTCSYSPEENIQNLNYFADHFHLTSISLDFPEVWGISVIEKGTAIGYQLYPHKLQGEGLFIAVMKNNAEKQSSHKKNKKPFQIFEPIPAWLKSHVANPEALAVHKNSTQHEIINLQAIDKANELLMHLPKAKSINFAGELKGRDFVPAHTLAMASLQSASYETIDLDLSTALDYLERDANTLPPVDVKGWYVVTYDGSHLGWAKWTGHAWKNHYPMNWRLRDRHKK